MRTSHFVCGALALTLVAACGSSPARSTAPTSGASTRATTAAPKPAPTTTLMTTQCTKPHPAGQSAQSFTFEGQPRTYQLFVPRSYDGRTQVPVVFNFHGFGSSSVQQMVYGDFKPLAERNNFLIVAPDGQGTTGRHFNFGTQPGLQNDVQMVGALLDHIEATLCVDTHRVFSAGMSNGGAMTTALACASNRFAAFGAVTASFYAPGCGGSRPVAIMLFSGTGDPVVPFNGGRVNCCGGATVRAAPEVIADWAAHDHCASKYDETRVSSEVRRRAWHGCDRGSDVVFYIIDGGGHTWPGAIPVARLGKTTTQINASETIWNFFEKHPLR
jgi:polyhydroxybutyrate depolymerase